MSHENAPTTDDASTPNGGDRPPLQRETLVMMNDRGKLGLLMTVAALGGVGVGFGLASLAFRSAAPCSPTPPAAPHALTIERSAAPFVVPTPPDPPMVFAEAPDCPHRARRHRQVDRLRLGVHMADAADGVRVTRVVDGSPAERAGLQVDDVVRRYDGEDIDDPSDLTEAVRRTKRGKRVIIIVTRDGEDKSVELSLE